MGDIRAKASWRDGRLIAIGMACAGVIGLASSAGSFAVWQISAISGAAGAVLLTIAIVGLFGAGIAGFAAKHLWTHGRAAAGVLSAARDAANGMRDFDALRISNPSIEARGINTLLDEIARLRDGVLLDLVEHQSVSGGETGDMLGAAVNTLSTGLVLTDATGHIDHANGAACVMLGLDPDALAEADLRESIANEEVVQAIADAVDGKIRRPKVIEFESSLNGEPCRLRAVVSGVSSDARQLAAVCIDDTTQHHAAAEARSSFVAQVTHELRTPLTNVRLYVEEAIEAEDDPKARAEALNVINSETRRLERVVSDMLSVSEMEAGAMRLHINDLRLDAMFTDLEAEYRAQAKEKNIEFRVDTPPKLPVIDADRERIALALHNLVGNAFKYTPDGGSVTVRVDAEEGSPITIEVEDTGIGISEQDAGRIFEKFYRANDDRVATITGTGLGLAMAREIVQMHGGDIELRSEVNKGSTFIVTLPGGRRTAAAA